MVPIIEEDAKLQSATGAEDRARIRPSADSVDPLEAYIRGSRSPNTPQVRDSDPYDLTPHHP
jgi:hypothetical protein